MVDAELRKAAVLLRSLPAEAATDLMARLPNADATRLSAELAALGEISSDEQSAVWRQFCSAAHPALAHAAEHGAAALRLAPVEVPPARLAFVAELDAASLAILLTEEHPQTIALVLACVSAEQAAGLLGTMPTERQRELTSRLAALTAVDRGVMQTFSQALAERLSDCLIERCEEVDGLAALARILNSADQVTERRLLDQLAQDTPEQVESIRRLRIDKPAVHHPSASRSARKHVA